MQQFKGTSGREGLVPNQPGWNPNQQWGQNQGPGGGWYGPPPGHQPPPPRKRRKWPFIVIPIAALLLVLAGRVFYVHVINPPKKTAASTSEAAPPPSIPAPTTSERKPPKPGEPIPCDERRPDSYQCFPDDFAPDAVMDSIAAEGWSCLREGQETESGGTVSAPRMCEAKDNVNQPYTIRASIEYKRFLGKPDGKLSEFTLTANTSASARKGEHTSTEDPPKALIRVFDITAKHIWQGQPELLKEATRTFEQLKPQCATPAGMTIEGVSATTPSGYTLTCHDIGMGVAVGDAVTYGQMLTIKPARP
ncbi:hypothetical protein ABT337_01900 [Saccharopolyspora hirsuta]|uniref:hypothetical protein n=1 Tax=Saccharopolyspora hirsuta TaxID=1837 RepID=UPI0033229AF7